MLQTIPADLPALIDRARQRLAEARTSAEVLETKAIAEAALHYAKVTGAANETHADCLRMIVRAEMRMADEIDAGQERGEVATQADGHLVRDLDKVRPTTSLDVKFSPSTLTDLGVDRRRLDEWRDTRDAGMEVVERAIGAALSEGRAPTKADVRRAVNGQAHVSNNSGENEWYTPEEFVEPARKVLGAIDLDPASCATANRVIKAKEFFTTDDDGLARKWSGRVWMNPPYEQPLVTHFAEKLVKSYQSKDVSAAIALVNNATETGWFRGMAEEATAVCFPSGRIRFWHPDRTSASPLQGQALLYFGRSQVTFHARFADLGTVWVKP